MDRAVLMTKLFPELGSLHLMYLLDGGFKRGQTEVHGGALGENVCS